MATGKALDGKPYAGNPHVRFDEGEVAPAATPRRGSLLYKLKRLMAVIVMAVSCLLQHGCYMFVGGKENILLLQKRLGRADTVNGGRICARPETA